MRKLGFVVVILGMAALGFIAINPFQASVSGLARQATEMEDAIAFQRLVVWAAFVGVMALATVVHGLGEVLMSRRDRNSADPPRPANSETSAMTNTEVNECGAPSPVPCDAPFDRTACQGGYNVMSQKPSNIETCPAPDRILHLPIGKAVGTSKSTTLMKSTGLELIRLVIPAGKEIPAHRAPGEITVQCIEGHVAFEHDGHATDLHAGDLLHLCPQEIHALKGIVDSSVLVTRLRPHADELPETTSGA